MIDTGYYNRIGYGSRAVDGDVEGLIVFSTEAALEMAIHTSEPIILVCKKTTPEDLAGMAIASAVVTLSGGLASHAAIVSREWKRPCLVGLGCADRTVLLPVIKEDGLWFGGQCYPEGTHAVLKDDALYLKEPE